MALLCMYTDFQGEDLMDYQQQLDRQDHSPTDQQPPGQTEVEPISARRPYIYIYTYMLRCIYAYIHKHKYIYIYIVHAHLCS